MKGWENVLLELGEERVNRVVPSMEYLIIDLGIATVIMQKVYFFALHWRYRYRYLTSLLVFISFFATTQDVTFGVRTRETDGESTISGKSAT